MNNIYLAYSTSHLPLSPLIKLVTWSKYSHIAIIINDKWVMHSDFNGVHIEPLEDLLGRSKTYMIVATLFLKKRHLIIYY